MYLKLNVKGIKGWLTVGYGFAMSNIDITTFTYDDNNDITVTDAYTNVYYTPT